MSDLPKYFAILRRQSTRGPFWQLFESIYHRSERAYEVKTPEWEPSIHHVTDSGVLPIVHDRVHFAHVKLPNGNIRQVVYWFVPVTLDIGREETVPLLDFSFKAWLPTPTHRIRLESANDILHILDSLQERWSHVAQGTSYILDEDEVPSSSIPYRPPTPPRQSSRASTPEQVDSDDDTQSIMTVYPAFTVPLAGSPNRLVFPPLPPSPMEDSSTPLPIPELVGTLLIRHAQASDGSCPISAVPYSEIHSLTATSCFHVFDTASLEQWRREHNSCPVCRNRIVNVVSK
jgi:hypothetical protein